MPRAYRWLRARLITVLRDTKGRGHLLLLGRLYRKMDIYSVGCIGLLRRVGIELVEGELSGRVLIQDPESVSRDGVVLRGDAATVLEDENCGQGRLFSGERGIGASRTWILNAGVTLLGAQVVDFVRQSLDLRCQRNIGAVVT